MQLIWGDDLDDALRPVLGVTLVGSAASSATWSFMAIWAIEELGAKAELPFALLVGAVLAALSGFIGGYLSDRIGRRRVILFGQAVMVGYPLLLLSVSDVEVGRAGGAVACRHVRSAGRLGRTGDGGRSRCARAASGRLRLGARRLERRRRDRPAARRSPARARIVVCSLPDRCRALWDRVARRVPLPPAPR